MATATSNAFSVVVASAAGVPAWYTALTANQWSTLPNSIMSTSGAGWTGTSPGGTSSPGYKAVIETWSGGILNPTGLTRPGGSFVAGPHLVVWGGGHNDYGGNEVYAYGSLLDASPQWRRLTDPTVPGPFGVARSGGVPSSRHTYDLLQHVTLGGINKMVSLGAGASYSIVGNVWPTTDLFNFAVDPSGTPWGTGPDIQTQGALGAAEAYTAVDASTGLVWYIGNTNGDSLNRYNSQTNAVTSWSKNNPMYGGGRKAAIDPRFTIMAWCGLGATAGQNNQPVYAIDLRNPASNNTYAPATTGTVPAAIYNLEWDPINQRFVAWTGGKTLYFLTLPANPYQGGSAWAWSSFTPPSGANPGNQGPTGTFGRFRYVPGPTQGFLVLNRYDEAIHFYKF